MKNKIKIDLHHVRHANVFDIIEKKIRNNLMNECCVEIVTGHSENMKKIVIDSFFKLGFKKKDIKIHPTFLQVQW